jgi:hypothetical protein
MREKSQYKSLAEWKKANPKDYQRAYHKDWLDDICERFGWERLNYDVKPSGYWTKEKCLKEARKFSFKSEWAKKSGGSYDKACTNGWLDECTAHMIEIRKPNGYWTKEKIIAEARKYNSIIEWQKNSNASINKARKLKIYGECITHMVMNKKPNGYWTKEKIIAESKKYGSITEWQKNSFTTYKKALKLNFIVDCTKHMK